MVATFAACGAHPESLASESHDQTEEALNWVNAVGRADQLDIGTWNIQWFGSAEEGYAPSPSDVQVRNARHVIRYLKMDLWVVTEIASRAAFFELVDALDVYDGVLSGEMDGGAEYYEDGDQQIGLLFDPTTVTVDRAAVVLTDRAYDFAGRPPIAIDARVNVGGRLMDVLVMGVHLKAMTWGTAWERRSKASRALQSYLDTNAEGRPVIVAGDWNDDVDGSTFVDQPTPFGNFFDAPNNYTFLTEDLSRVGASTSIHSDFFLDHILGSAGLDAAVVDIQVFDGETAVDDFVATTSDHHPVLASIGSGPAVFLNEVLANEPGSARRGEFVELVNASDVAIDISGYVIGDADRARIRLPEGALIEPGGAFVVTGADAHLGLANGGDTVRLFDAHGHLIDSMFYTADQVRLDGVSLNRSPDGAFLGSWVTHRELSTSDSSPGGRP